MRTQSILAALLACLLAFAGGLEARPFAEQPWHKAVHPKKQEVSINPGGLAWGTADLNYEAALGRMNSWLAGVDLGVHAYPGWTASAAGAHGSYRWWWLENRALQGIYAGPRVGLLSYAYTYDWYNGSDKYTESASAVGVSVGGEGGYQWIFNNGLLLRGGGELSYVLGSVSTKAGAPPVGFGLVLNGTVAAGYAW